MVFFVETCTTFHTCRPIVDKLWNMNAHLSHARTPESNNIHTMRSWVQKNLANNVRKNNRKSEPEAFSPWRREADLQQKAQADLGRALDHAHPPPKKKTVNKKSSLLYFCAADANKLHLCTFKCSQCGSPRQVPRISLLMQN